MIGVLDKVLIPRQRGLAALCSCVRSDYSGGLWRNGPCVDQRGRAWEQRLTSVATHGESIERAWTSVATRRKSYWESYWENGGEYLNIASRHHDDQIFLRS